MTQQNVYAIGYNLDMERPVSEKSARITFAWAVDSEHGVMVRVPHTWTCKLPDPAEYVDHPFGTAETRGILGGVQHPLLHAQSEAVERATGDALTAAFAEILDWGKLLPSIVMVLGPAFPKVLGRFLSLRPPTETGLVWVTPIHVPSPLGHLWRLLLPRQVGTGPAMVWSNETLLHHFLHPGEGEPRYWGQILFSGEVDKIEAKVRAVLDKPTIKQQHFTSRSLPEVEVPRELRLALHVAEADGMEPMPYVTDQGVKFLRFEDDNARPPYLLEAVGADTAVYPWNPETLS